MAKTESKKKKTREVPIVKENYVCLLVKINEPHNNADGTISSRTRHLFTEQKNFNYLIELSRAFGLDLITVRVHSATILPFSDLIAAIKDDSYNALGNFVEINNRTPGKEEEESIVLKKNYSKNKIHCKLRKKFLDGSVVSIENEALFFKVTSETIKKHIRKIKKTGIEIVKIKSGIYSMVPL